jgi:hypothetical protein
LSSPKRLMSVIRPASRAGLSVSSRPEQHVGLEARAALDSDRVADAAQELDVRAAGEARAVADPQHVRAGVIPLPGQRILRVIASS